MRKLLSLLLAFTLATNLSCATVKAPEDVRLVYKSAPETTFEVGLFDLQLAVDMAVFRTLMVAREAKSVTLHINSPGGYNFSYDLVHELMQDLISKGVKVTCVAEGMIASNGAVLFAACPNRYIVEGTHILFHSSSASGNMKEGELNYAVKAIHEKNLEQRTMLEDLGIEDAVIDRMMSEEDVFYTVEEFLKLAPTFAVVLDSFTIAQPLQAIPIQIK